MGTAVINSDPQQGFDLLLYRQSGTALVMLHLPHALQPFNAVTHVSPAADFLGQDAGRAGGAGRLEAADAHRPSQGVRVGSVA